MHGMASVGLGWCCLRIGCSVVLVLNTEMRWTGRCMCYLCADVRGLHAHCAYLGPSIEIYISHTHGSHTLWYYWCWLHSSNWMQLLRTSANEACPNQIKCWLPASLASTNPWNDILHASVADDVRGIKSLCLQHHTWYRTCLELPHVAMYKQAKLPSPY